MRFSAESRHGFRESWLADRDTRVPGTTSARRHNVGVTPPAEFAAADDVTLLAAPEGLDRPPPPGAGGSSLAQYVAWLDSSRAALGSRIVDHRGELDRVAAQWAHVVVNLKRLTTDEVTLVHEAQARLRERIATDIAWEHMLGIEAERVAAWADAVLTSSVDALTGISLDLDIAQRRIDRDPAAAAGEFTLLRERLSRVSDELRGLPDVVQAAFNAGADLPGRTG